jgi:hypothetical protein
MAKYVCRCGTITRDDDPDFGLSLFSGREYDAARDMHDLFLDAHQVWHCPICDRLWVFWEPGPGVWPIEYVRWRPSLEETAARLQVARGVTLSRSPDPTLDWVDEQGIRYAAVGGFHRRHFAKEWPHLQTRIRDAQAAADIVVVDTAELAQEQRAAVEAFIAPLGAAVVLVDAGWLRP